MAACWAKKVEAVVVDPASNWPLFAEKARDLLAKEKVAVVFGCWTSVSRKSVLPVFEELNGLLFSPVQHEGEESSKTGDYTGAAPNQQAIPAVEYLMSADGGNVKRWVLEGTDYVYPRTTNKILEAFLKSKGVAPEDIKINYTPFGFSDWQTEVAAIKQFASAGKKTAVVSTINGDANVPFYKELANAGVKASDIPVVAFSVGEEELAGVGTKPLVGHLTACRNYFQSVKKIRANDAFIKQWHDFIDEAEPHHQRPDGSHLYRLQDVDACRRTGRHHRRQRGTPGDVRPEGPGAERPGRGDEHQPHHPVRSRMMIEEIRPDGQFDVVWQTKSTIQGRCLEPVPARGQGQDRRLELSVGLRQLHRGQVQGLVSWGTSWVALGTAPTSAAAEGEAHALEYPRFHGRHSR